MKSSTYEATYQNEKSHWWYRGRRKLVDILVDEATRGKVKPNIVDVGCGTGTLLFELEKYGNVKGVDMSPEAVSYCNKRGLKNVWQGDVTSLPLDSGSSDVLLALDMLEHVEDAAAGVREMARVLKSDGTAILFVPALKILWGSTDEVSHHFRRYNKKTLRKVLEENGFTIERMSYFNSFLFLPILAARLLARLTGKEMFDEYRPGVGPFNEILYKIFALEVDLLKYISYPVGVSVMAICRQQKQV